MSRDSQSILITDDIAQALLNVIEPDNAFYEEINWYLNDYPWDPLLQEEHVDKVRRAILDRGKHLWHTLAQTKTLIESGLKLGYHEIRVIGSSGAAAQPWEITREQEDKDPISITIPVVRVPSGSRAYTVPMRRSGLLRVLSVSARKGPRDIIPPRRISLHLVRMKWLSGHLNFQLVEPGEFRHLKQVLDLERDLFGISAFDVLHIDAHGELHDYASLHNFYGETRRLAQEMGLLTPITPYEGQRGFIILEHDDGALAVTGRELGTLAMEHGISTVVMNVCNAGSQDAAESVAIGLVRAGVPDVVAFGHMLTLRGAELLVDGFYESLAKDLSVSKAVMAARLAMYRDKMRNGAGGVEVELDDWMSLFHYQTEHREDNPISPELWAATNEEVIDERPTADALTELPLRWEWYIWLLSKALRSDSTPYMVYGIRGAGIESIVDEFLRWTTLRTQRTPYPLWASLSGGLDQFIQELFEGMEMELQPETTHPADIISKLVSRCRQEPRLFAFSGIDKGLEGGTLTIEEIAFVYQIAQDLRGAGSPVILTDTIELNVKAPPRPLADLGPCTALRIFPLFWQDLADWTCFEATPVEDNIDALSRILIGVLGGGVSPLLWVQQYLDADMLEALLDIVVLHAGDEQPEAWDRLPEICQRDLNESYQAITMRLNNSDHLLLPMLDKFAIVGASVTWTHLGMLEIDTPRNQPKKGSDLQDELQTLASLSRLGLAQQVADSNIFKYREGVFQFDPHLRHCLRRRLSAGDVARWDRSHQTLYASLLKQHQFRNEEIGGQKSARDLMAVDLSNILISLWRALRGYASLIEIIDGFVNATHANIWPDKLDIRPWLIHQLCLMGEVKELSIGRRIDLARSLAVLGAHVPRLLADKASASVVRILAPLREVNLKEMMNAGGTHRNQPIQKSPDRIEVRLGQIDAIAQENLQEAFSAAIELGEEILWADGRNLTDASVAFQKAVELGQRLGGDLKEALATYGLGVTEVMRQRLDDAENHFRKAILLASGHGPNLIVAESYYELGYIFEVRGDMTRAKSYYRLAVTEGQNSDSISAIIHSYQNLVNINLNQGAVKVARDLLNHADDLLSSAILEARCHAEEKSRNRLLRARIEAALGNLDGAKELIPEPDDIPDTRQRNAAATLRHLLDVLMSQ